MDQSSMDQLCEYNSRYPNFNLDALAKVVFMIISILFIDLVACSKGGKKIACQQLMSEHPLLGKSHGENGMF